MSASNNDLDSRGVESPQAPPKPMTEPEPANEETPLLRNHDDNDNAATTNNNNDDVDANGETTVLAPEPSNRRLALVLGSIYVGVFLGALDTTVIATLSAPIAASFDSLSLLSWVASAYLVANAACQPLSGRLTDIFGRRSGLVVSNLLFGAGNLVCGLARSEGAMVAGRVVAGMGGGGLMAISTFVASDLVPLRKRGVIQGIGNLAYGTGAGLGGVFGGWVNDVWGWRVAFLSQVPLIAVSAVLVFFVVDIPPKVSERSRLARVDFLGALLLVLTLVLLLAGLNSGGNVVAWTHPLVLTTLPLSAVCLAAYVWVEARWAREPVIPVRLLLDRTVAAACLTNWFTTMALYASLFYVPIYFQVRGMSTTVAGVHLIPQSVGASIGSLGTGLLMNRTGKYYLLGVSLCATFVVGAGLLAVLDMHTPDWPGSLFLFLIGSGYGGVLTVTLLAVISAVDHEHQAVVTSATYAFRSTGSTIGITIASAVYQNVLKSELWAKFGDREGAADEIRRIRDRFDELKHLPPGWEDGVYSSYIDALRAVFLTCLGMGALGLICMTFIRQNVLHSTLARK